MKKNYNTLVIGSGCAGFNAADRLYSLGVTDIALVCEGINMGTSRNTGSDKQTYYKLSLCGGEGDSVREMAQTLFEGGGVNGDTALIEAAYSVRCFMHLVELGVPFPVNECGEYVAYKTDHDPRRRATSCGPLTSKLMTEALERSVAAKHIEILDGYRVIKIMTDKDGVCGVALCDADGGIFTVGCKNVILATGGPAGIYHNSVYPESQSGGSGIAVDAGCDFANFEEWQYGLASTSFRWNVSGTYQQVIPRYISVDANGVEREFLSDALKDEAATMIFLKGYQWPFDTRKVDGSSRVDLLVFNEICAGRRVFMDFTRNMRGFENGITPSLLSAEAYTYLKNSEALFGTPIERLEKMNSRAIALYAAHGIDLYKEPLEIAVCSQHSNGGVAVDADWQSNIRGLYAVGEAAGTFGIYRPGGSALNSTQVGSLRAAEHIASLYNPNSAEKSDEQCKVEYKLPDITFGESNIGEIRGKFTRNMSECAAFVRDIAKMSALFDKTSALCKNFFSVAVIKDKSELCDLFRLYDTLLTARTVLSAMIFSAKRDGTHGSALVLGENNSGSATNTKPRTDITITGADGVSRSVPPRPIPNAELWFEKVLQRTVK